MFQRFLATLKYVPDDFTRARIYKKGDPDNPEHYRPISLLNTRYNFFAYIIKKNISDIIDGHLGNTQFGFRKSRSTVEPIFCVRRLADFAEQGNDLLWLIFLDWEKAFDKLDREKMCAALSRLNIPHSINHSTETLSSELLSKPTSAHG